MKKPKTCQWVDGFKNKEFSAYFNCKQKPMFEVQVHGITVCWVCPQHSVEVTQKGYQIR